MKEITSQIVVSGIAIQLTRKKVKNLNIRVRPSEGRVRVSCPWRMPENVVKSHLQSKLPWIRKHLGDFRKQAAQPDLKFVTGEDHLFRGGLYQLNVVYQNSAPEVICREKEIELRVRPGSSREKREKVMNEWYRQQMKMEIPRLFEKWEPVMGVSVREFGVKQMKTRWGTCNIRAKRIWLNLELAKKLPECLEVVVVHEMVHLLERLHSKRFYRLMDQFLPNWREREEKLISRKTCNHYGEKQ